MLHFKKQPNHRKVTQEARRAYIEQLALIRQFKKDDEGGLIVLTLLLLISMLVVGGMAVDFMRFESERTKLQSVSDRAVLAAANLNQDLGSAEIVRNFFEVEGFPNAITSNLDVPSADFDKTSGSSVITLQSQVEVDTFYLWLVGMDTLTAPASSSAIEGTGNVEISLILDISGSMGTEMTGQAYYLDDDDNWEVYDEDDFIDDPSLDPLLLGKRKTQTVTEDRMFFLRQAANQFVEDLLLPKYEDRVSINLIAYSQHVSLGDELYTAIKTRPDSISEEGLVGSSFGTVNITDNYSAPFEYIYQDSAGDEVIYVDFAFNSLDPDEPGGTWVFKDNPTLQFTGVPVLRGIADYPIDVTWANGKDVFVNPSRCVNFEDEEYNTLEFDKDRIYEQVAYADYYTTGEEFYRPYAPCPAEDYEGIIVMSQDVEELQGAISQLKPTLNTSIHRGMKWGTALLDPSMRDVIDRIPTVDSAFRGSRPSEYNDGVTSKYIVIMTDGQTVSSRRMVPEHYVTYDQRIEFRDHSAYYHGQNDGNSSTNYWNMTESIGAASELNAKLTSLCTLAAANVNEVYTISMGVQNTTMTTCASDDGNAFTSTITNEPGEEGLADIFERISNQITALRLSQ